MKKVLTIVISIALITALAIGGTLAYLSSNANGTNLENTFTTSTAGSKLAITLDEAKVDPKTGLELTGAKAARITANEYPVIPGATMDKDPTVTVIADSSPCYVFVYVENTAKMNGKDVAATGQIDSNWALVDSTKYPGLYVYSATQDKIVPTSQDNETLPAVFNTITIDPTLNIEDIAEGAEGRINVQAYAYQASANVSYETAKDAVIEHFFPANS